MCFYYWFIVINVFIKEGCLNLKFDRRDLGMMNGFMYVVMIVYNEDLIKKIVI